mmetsp:Transcript_25052/g.38882  ORF Transcript_25052/g.38882 Transcript_25052/m.38882 type:complete len:85 (-) Transcript_25052:520-774(-)
MIYQDYNDTQTRKGIVTGAQSTLQPPQQSKKKIQARMQSGASTSMGVVNPTDLLNESISEIQQHSKASLQATRTASTKLEGKPR